MAFHFSIHEFNNDIFENEIYAIRIIIWLPVLLRSILSYNICERNGVDLETSSKF
jgi:hypothetical protein